MLGHLEPLAGAALLVAFCVLALGGILLFARRGGGSPLASRLLFGGSVIGVAFLLPIVHPITLFRSTFMASAALALRLEPPILQSVALLDQDPDARARVLDAFLQKLQASFSGTDAGGTAYTMRGLPPYRALDATAERSSWASPWTASIQVITPDGWQPADRNVSFLAGYIFGPARAEPVGDGRDAAKRIEERLASVLDALAADPEFSAHVRR